MNNAPNDSRGRYGPGAAPVRVGAVALLVVLAVVAARARAAGATPPRVAGPVGAAVIDLLGALCVAVLVAGSVLLVWAGWTRGRRVAPAVARPPRMSARRRALVAALLGVLVALGVLLLTRRYPLPRPDWPPRAAPADQPVAPPGQRVTPPGAPNGGVNGGPAHELAWSGLVDYVIVFALLAAALALVVALARRGRAPVPPLDGVAAEAAMASAVVAGRAVVRDTAITDPRRAIVACFAAMEDALARRGGVVAPRPADTAAEVVTRGLTGARVPEEPARALLELFREARFSEHPMHPAAREAADRALAVILTALKATAAGVGGPR